MPDPFPHPYQSIANVLAAPFHIGDLPTDEIADIAIRLMPFHIHGILCRVIDNDCPPEIPSREDLPVFVRWQIKNALVLHRLCQERTGHTVNDARLIPLKRLPVVLSEAYGGLYANERLGHAQAKHYYDLCAAVASYVVHETRGEI